MPKQPAMTAEELLVDHIPPMQEIAERLLAIVRDEVPGVEERVARGWHSLNFRLPGVGLFAGIFPRDDHVTIAWEWGKYLDDRAGFMTGGLQLKRMRFRQLFDLDEIDEAAIRDLLRQAVALKRPGERGEDE